MTRKTIPQRMDDLVMWTGIPRIAGAHPRRRPLRWLSVAAIVGSTGGLIVSAAVGFARPLSWIGYAVLVVSFSLGTLLQVFGPLKPFNAGERVDEFDRNLRARAYLFAFPWFALATATGLLALMYMMVMQVPRAEVIQCLAELMLVLPTLGFSLPTAYASWAVEWDKDGG